MTGYAEDAATGLGPLLLRGLSCREGMELALLF